MKTVYFFIGLFFLLACTKETADLDTPSSIEEPLQWKIGKNEFNIEVDGAIRNFIVHVPNGYTLDQAVPLLFMLHGSSGSGDRFYNISGWVEKSEQEGFIVVFPTAMEVALKNGRKSTKWSTQGTKIDALDSSAVKDDLPFFDEMLALMKRSFSIDQKRVYACGFSNGAAMVRSELLIRWSDELAAIATAGGFGLPFPLEIEHGFYLPLYATVGNMDDRILDNLIDLNEIPLDGQKIVSHEVIGAQIANFLATVKLDNAYTEEPNKPNENTITFDQNLSDQDNEFKLKIIKGLKHKFPNGTNNPSGANAADYLWPWFIQWSK